MCYNCGCMLPDDSMGSEENITNKKFEDLAAKKGKSVDDVKHDVFHMVESGKITDPDVKTMFSKASEVWGQSEQEAEKNTRELLQQVLKHKVH